MKPLSKPQQDFLAALACSLKECRNGRFNFSVQESMYHALGMLAAALNLEAITDAQYSRLSRLALNAGSVRRHELLKDLPPHSRTALPGPAERAA